MPLFATHHSPLIVTGRLAWSLQAPGQDGQRRQFTHLFLAEPPLPLCRYRERQVRAPCACFSWAARYSRCFLPSGARRTGRTETAPLSPEEQGCFDVSYVEGP